MNPFEMVVLIVLIIGVVRIVQARSGVIRTGRGKEEMFIGTGADKAATEQLRNEVRQLKDRIAVLERIVTDGDRNRGLALEREIEALRDEREGR